MIQLRIRRRKTTRDISGDPGSCQISSYGWIVYLLRNSSPIRLVRHVVGKNKQHRPRRNELAPAETKAPAVLEEELPR